MTAPALAASSPVLRTVSGEPPLGPGGLSFRDDQGEIIAHDNPRYAAAARIGVLELEGGDWLIWRRGKGFPIVEDGRRYETRTDAFEDACDNLIALARLYMAAQPGEGTHWSEEFGEAVISWADKQRPRKEEISGLFQGANAQGMPAIGHPGTENGTVQTPPYRVSVQFSGGAASYVAAKLILEEFGHDGVALVFADTLIEDEDLYRFLGDAEKRLQHPIIRISEGRDPWMVFFDERMMGNSRVDPCSKILKRKLLDKWRAEHCASDCTLVIGYDASEDFRLQPLKARMAPLNVRAPLLEQGIFKEQAYARVEADGIRLPRLYQMGFPHNNCGGFCVKAGQASFALLLEHMPDRYAKHEAKEEAFRNYIGKDVSIMRDRRGGVSKPLTMRAFRERHLADSSLVDRSELGGCTCMDEPSENAGVTDDSDGELSGALIQEPPADATRPDPLSLEGPTWCDTLTDKMCREELTIAGYEASDAGAGLSDPVVKYLVQQHRLRRQFPAKHAFSMTTEVTDGRIISVATCACKQVLKFPSNDPLRMDAAIEAHWRRFSHQPTVGGRGNQIEINAEKGAVESPEAPQPKKKRSRRSAPHAGDNPELANAALPEPALSDAPRAEGAGSPLSNIADDQAPDRPRSEPAPVAPPEVPSGAGSPLFSPGAGGRDPAPIASASSASGGVDGAGASGQAAQICAPDNVIMSPDDIDDLALEWPSYDTFLEGKIVTAPMRGIEVPRDALHPYLKPHCKDLTVWALRLGCAAIFANFGLHKTAMQLEWCRQLQRRAGGITLCVLPLGVRHGFIKEALQLSMDVRFVRTDAEVAQLRNEGVAHFLTNYESIREGKLDPNLFAACSLDEASVLRSYGSKTFQGFLPLFSKVTFKLVATATPSPNRYKELIHYAGFLGVMDTGLALTRWFQRNSEKAGDLTLYPHKEDEFWMWVHSWAAFLQKPSELGHSDDGYELPPLKIRWHEVPADHSKAEPERDGQGVMFRDIANSLSEAAKARRDSLAARIRCMMEIIAQDPQATFLIWHDLEAEREAIEAALPGVVTITGSMDLDAREQSLADFEEGRTKYFGTKPILSGSGSNFQYHCHKAIYVAMPGYGYKFNDFLQSLYRLQRFGQEHPVEVDIIYSEDERAGKAVLEEKWARDAEMRARMSEIIRCHGLNTLPLRDALLRTIGIKRVEIASETVVNGTPLWRAINNDAIEECRVWPENSVDQIITSVPFSNHYEYSASYRDLGHTDDNAHFWSQMDFLTCELLRVLKPGRLACIHVKDRVLFGAVTGEGVPTISPFHAEAIMHYRAHGFQYMGMITVVTDVVRENNQTNRLGWSENAKDSTKMGVGSPEYVLLFRKRQSDRTRSYADNPVTKVKPDLFAGEGEGYSRAQWQVDAHAFWRSSGNRLLSSSEFAEFDASDMAKAFAKLSNERVYDHEAHVRIGEALERKGALPATFMAIAPGSHHPEVWHDINRMRTLNMMQQKKGAEMHLCPLQFDIVDRLIDRYSNEGDLIFDPFGGLMTVPYRAILKKRRGAATELSATYFLDGVKYLEMAEQKMSTPALFDLAGLDAVNT
ncbi:MAG TPA: DNA methyltransferase, partial [Candidatus Cybelea sp.]|nr:DNA methyltransferase [Candidatus Cybelea sp.]